jgi:hypothetical protein
MVLFIAQIEEGFASKIIDLHLAAVMEEGACYCCDGRRVAYFVDKIPSSLL